MLNIYLWGDGRAERERGRREGRKNLLYLPCEWPDCAHVCFECLRWFWGIARKWCLKLYASVYKTNNKSMLFLSLLLKHPGFSFSSLWTASIGWMDWKVFTFLFCLNYTERKYRTIHSATNTDIILIVSLLKSWLNPTRRPLTPPLCLVITVGYNQCPLTASVPSESYRPILFLELGT